MSRQRRTKKVCWMVWKMWGPDAWHGVACVRVGTAARSDVRSKDGLLKSGDGMAAAAGAEEAYPWTGVCSLSIGILLYKGESNAGGSEDEGEAQAVVTGQTCAWVASHDRIVFLSVRGFHSRVSSPLLQLGFTSHSQTPVQSRL